MIKALSANILSNAVFDESLNSRRFSHSRQVTVGFLEL